MVRKAIKHVSVPKLELFGPKETVMGERSWRIGCYIVWENRLVGILLLTNTDGFGSMNVQRFSKL